MLVRALTLQEAEVAALQTVGAALVLAYAEVGASRATCLGCGRRGVVDHYIRWLFQQLEEADAAGSQPSAGGLGCPLMRASYMKLDIPPVHPPFLARPAARHPRLAILSYPILSYPILSYPILSYPILSYPILSDPILSYPILSYPILSYPIRS
jgi:hypothetical protein